MFQYKTERNGVVETRVEQKITIQSDGDPIDHDRALAEAIQVRDHPLKRSAYCEHSTCLIRRVVSCIIIPCNVVPIRVYKIGLYL